MKLLNEKGLKCFLHNIFHDLDNSGFLQNDVDQIIEKSFNIVYCYFEKYDVNEFYSHLEEYSKKYRIHENNMNQGLAARCDYLLKKNQELEETNQKLLIENSNLTSELEISNQNHKVNYSNYFELKQKIEFLLVTHKCVF